MLCLPKNRPAEIAAGCLLLMLTVASMCCAACELAYAGEESASKGADMSANALPDFISMWNFADPAATESQFRELLPQAEASGDQLYLIELLTQIARAQGLQSSFPEAHATLDRVELLLAQGAAEQLARGRLRYLLERGRAFNSSGEEQSAQPLFMQAWELGQTTAFDGLTIDAAHMLGIVTKDQESLDWNLRALDIAERTTDPKAANWKGALYYNIGWTYMDMDDPGKALELFQRGVEFREANAHPENNRMIAHWTVARALRGLERYDEALQTLKDISVNFAGYSDDGFWHEEMGENLLALGEWEASRGHFEAALPLLQAMGWVEESEPLRIARIQTFVEQDIALLALGSEAPAFSLHNQLGNAVSLAQYAGQPLVLVFYAKDMTGG